VAITDEFREIADRFADSDEDLQQKAATLSAIAQPGKTGKTS
jgi:hypothetical protein